MFELVGYVVMFLFVVSFLELPPLLARARPLAWVALVLAIVLMIYLVRRPPLDEIQMPETKPKWRRGGVGEFFRHFGTTFVRRPATSASSRHSTPSWRPHSAWTATRRSPWHF
jgi:hypothetical protein